MDKNWHTLERLLRQGERAAVLRALHALERSRLNRTDRLQAARLYRKAGFPARSLRVLGPWDEQASELHRAEYGAALVNLGALREGARILDSLDGARDPRVGWLRAASHIQAWDWVAAIPLLERLSGTTLYLATCLIHGTGEQDRASALLEEILRSPRPELAEDPRLVRSTAWLLLAQSRALAGESAAASLALARSRATLPPAARGAMTLLTWMIRQWELLLELRENGGPGRNPQPALDELLGEVRAGFRALEGWEWARGCSLFAAEILGDRGTLERLYWTTPYPAFRARVLRSLGATEPPAGPYELRLGDRSRFRLGVASGLLREGRAEIAQLKPGQAGHRLLGALASDFHRPHRLAELHERAFPGEGFRPEVSLDRVSKNLQRLNHWLRENSAPLAIRPGRGGYSLCPERGCTLVLTREDPAERPPPGPALLAWVRSAREAFGRGEFTTAQALRALGGSRRTVARRLAEAHAAGLLLRQGSGPRTTYRQGGR